MKAIQVTIRLDPTTMSRVDAAAQNEREAAARITKRPIPPVPRSVMLCHLIEIGLTAYNIEAERVAAQSEVLG